ncbi:MAG: AAA family ATPase [Clostridium sp.]|nr:AAA family ATPase [Clostridium sp.]
MLAHSETYRLAGARLPKGALLVGPPGTGKTLLARAVAGETAKRIGEADPGCSGGRTAFIALAATDLLSGGQSAGADRVRDLFLQAQKAEAASVVIFIDELDAVAKRRGTRGGADEVLIALLACMDGFSGNQNLFVLGATNRPEVLDPALLRPGRFDRRIPVGLPDRRGREDILRLYAEKQLRPALAVSLGTDENSLDARWKEKAEAVIREAAARSYGASPAELANLVNEAGILAAARGRRPDSGPADGCLYTVTLEDILEALENMIVGLPTRKTPGARDKKIVAVHETGHAIMSVVDGEGNPISGDEAKKPFEKVTCVPRGESALGYVINLSKEEKQLETKDDLLGEVRCLLGGRAAEELTGGSGGITQGAGNDLARATGIVKKMVAQYGMYDLFGPAAVLTGSDDYLGNDRTCSILPGLEQEISREVIRILREQYDQTLKILTRWQGSLEQIAGELTRRETLSGEEFMEIWTRAVKSA